MIERKIPVMGFDVKLLFQFDFAFVFDYGYLVFVSLWFIGLFPLDEFLFLFEFEEF